MNAKDWADKYRIGVLEIDEQHGMLFQLLYDFETASSKGASPDLQAEVLQRLLTYVMFHFRAEEKLMANCDFPELKHHVSQHREFEAKMVEFVAEFEQRKTNVSSSLIQFLKDWIFNHILVEDKKISQFLGNAEKREVQ